MKLFHLYPKNPDDPDFKRWYYDSQHAIVVRAKNEKEARELANQDAGDVTRFGKSDIWLDPTRVVCVVLTHAGKPGVVIVDFRAG
jgi:hypothetical protein